MNRQNIPKLSVVVCTYNRAELLRQALESLACQSLGRELFEIVVVDNHSTDGTQAVTRAFQQEHPSIQFILAYEAEIGLGHARNRGWRQAKGLYIAFMDDDAKADPHWLKHALEIFGKVSPSPLGIGGPIFPHYAFSKPCWFKDEYEIRSWGSCSRELEYGETFSGSNMIIRRDLLAKLGGFDVRVGMKGTRLSVGEETALFQRLWKDHSRGALYYSPELVVYHAVGQNKMRVLYHLKRAFVTGKVWYFQNGPRAILERLRFVRQTVRAIRLLSSEAIKSFRSFPDHHNWIIERLSPVALEAGRLLGVLGAIAPLQHGDMGGYGGIGPTPRSHIE